MNTLIVVPAAYPPGPASATHAQLLALGLRAAGGNAGIIGLLKTPTDRPLDQWATDAQGVSYRLLPFLNSRWGKWAKLPRYLLRMPSLYRTAIEDEVRNGRCDSVIFFGHSWSQSVLLVRACNRLRIPVVPICTEWWRFQRIVARFYWDQELFRLRLLPRADGMIAISRPWEKYARSHNMRVIRVPALSSDAPAGPCPGHKPRGEFRLVYVGVMHPRDLPMTLLSGVREALHQGVSVRLIVVGRMDIWPVAKHAQSEASNCPVLRGHVEFTGWASDQAMQEQRRLADAFVLLRNDDWDSRFCFPTRLPEYLLTAKPVILSDVGDVALYLQHRRNAWLLPPGDRPRDVAGAIAALAGNREEACTIGRAGREIALREFSFRVHGPRLLEFLNACRSG
jgi:glycosyltransferase involved in cell wall biosynthesis